MEHSHPLSDGPYISPGLRSLPPTTASVATSPINFTATPPRLNQQSRRLQLRNVGFKGPVLPARRMSPILGASQHASEPFSRPANSENSPISSEKRVLYGEDLPPSPVSILQEIHNSNRRRRVSPRTGFGQIFEDNTATEPIERGGRSWYNEASNSGSPMGMNMTPVNATKLCEVSLNGKTSQIPSSPLAKQVKGRNENHPGSRSTSSEASRYIEHLEAQLCAVNAKLDAVTSPSTSKARSAKLRALTAESRSLRQEVSDWECHFGQRLKEEMGQRLDVETGLNTRLQELEDDSEVKDAKIKELECELQSIQAKAKEVEGLEAVNVDLERRIDVLTNLLVRSPTKLELSSATSSPSKASPHRRTPRPRSMLPRVPCSPGGVRLSLSTVSESAFWHSRSLGSTSSISESPEGVDPTTTHEEEILSPGSNHDSGHFSSVDLDSGGSAFFRSGPTSSSRPTSIQSASSLGTASWGLPLPPNTESQAKSMNRQRRMRRFPSGSCSLKPLILPTAATIPSLPASAPVYSSSPTPSCNITDISLDPTTAFLSRHDFSSPISTPTQPIRQESASGAQEQTLRSLEGKGRQPESADSPLSIPEEQRKPVYESPLDSRRPRHARPRSLEEELKQAGLITEYSFEDGLIPADLDKGAELDTIPIGLDSFQPHTPHDQSLRQRHTPALPDTTPRPDPRPVSATFPSSKVFQSSSFARRNAFAMFSRLTNLIRQTKQDPSTLAQRILHNAWTLGSARLGRMGWWLMGLLFGSCWRKRKRAADGVIADGPPKNNFDWHHYSARASRRRTAEHCLRSHGSNYELLPQATPQPGTMRQSSATAYHRPREESQVFPCDRCIEPSSHRTLRLWWQFSLAIVLAVGVAIKHGPGALLVDDDLPPPSPPMHRPSHRILDQQPPKQIAKNNETLEGPVDRDNEEDGDGWNSNFTFAEPLGPGDFERS